MNGLKLEGRILKVQPAKSESSIPKYSSHPTRPPQYRKFTPQFKPIPNPSWRDHRSYRDVSVKPSQKPSPPANPTNPTSPLIESHHHTDINQSHLLEQFQEIGPQPDLYNKNPSMSRLLSSKILRKATEEARDQISAEDINEDFALVIQGTRNGDNDDLFSRSITGVANSSMSSTEILNCILAEGVISITIKPLGGLLHLITFESIEEKVAMIQSNWLEQWFSELSDINAETSTRWREISLNIVGVPLSAWNYDNFHKIGSVFGRVISMDYSSFVFAKAIIITDCLFNINCKMWLSIDDQKFPIFIFEPAKVVHQNGKTSNPHKLSDQSPPVSPVFSSETNQEENEDQEPPLLTCEKDGSNSQENSKKGFNDIPTHHESQRKNDSSNPTIPQNLCNPPYKCANNSSPKANFSPPILESKTSSLIHNCNSPFHQIPNDLTWPNLSPRKLFTELPPMQDPKIKPPPLALIKK